MRKAWLVFCQIVTLSLAAYLGYRAFAHRKLPAEATAPAGSLAGAARIASPSVVSVCLPPDELHDKVLCIGSGVVVDSQSHVLTNAHVVSKRESMLVQLADGHVLKAKLTGSDPETDLAVLQADLPDPASIRFEDAALLAGEPVLAIGNPFGMGLSVTSGVVSALDRSRASDGIPQWIQIDAAIKPGDSGGALVNAAGHLVGITSAYGDEIQGARGFGYAIPVSIVRPVLASLIARGYVLRGWIGVDAEESGDGVRLREILDGGPARMAGLHAGDVIIRIGNASIASMGAFTQAVSRLAPGVAVPFTVKRGAAQLTIAVKPGSRSSRQAK